MKPFYGKEWLHNKLVDYLLKSDAEEARCLILLGETATGKTHLASELKRPTVNASLTSLKQLNQRMINAYFLNKRNKQKRSSYHLRRFCQHLSKALLDLARLKTCKISEDNEPETDGECLSRSCVAFTREVLAPLKEQTALTESYFILIDGFEDAECATTEMILSFLNRTFPHFPKWLHLVLTSNRCTEKKYVFRFSILKVK